MGRPTAAPFGFAALNRVNIVEDTAILVFHVRVIVLHVRRHSRFMIPRRSYHAHLRARRSRGALPCERQIQGGLPHREAEGFWGAEAPQGSKRDRKKWVGEWVWQCITLVMRNTIKKHSLVADQDATVNRIRVQGSIN